MPGFAFPGGIETVEIADAEDFDTATNANFAITVDRTSIAAEGFDIPEPEAVTAALADDREVRLGVDQSLSLRFTDLDSADFDSLEAAANGGTEVFVRITSTQKDGNGNPRWQVVYNRVILSHVAHGPANADRSTYGVVIVDGMTTGGTTADIYSITQNSA
jgi:hypothetical protein